jgi:hypothetical protein
MRDDAVLLVGPVQEDLSLSQRSVPRAPTRDGAVVAVPPLSEAGALLAANRQRLHAHADGRTLLGRPWSDLRRQARQSAVEAALAYLGEENPKSEIRNPKGDTLLVAGHQPELFHAGVWVKNFALCGLAQAHGATSLNLVVDNDTVKTTALRVPAPPEREGDRPHVRSVLFDRWTGEVPYEERAIADRELFASFAERAGVLLRGWHYEPMLPEFWAEVRRQAQHTPILGECFAAARRTFERAWGCHNLEVPLSAVCRTAPFAWFACHLLAELPRFHALHNTIVADYRRRHGIRGRHHPVPDLAAEGDWLEAPLWGWRTGTTRRGRLFARRRADGIEIRIGDESRFRLSNDPQTAVRAWLDLEGQGIKVRSRALTTTLYARLFLADLFVHGIGGGKYDELTDELIRRFHECEPPSFLVLSATRWLPLPAAAVSPDDCRRLARAVRDMHYNPQRHLAEFAAGEDMAGLVVRKQAWIDREPATAEGRRERFRVLRALTGELRRPVQAREEQLRRELDHCRRQLQANAVIQRRDYSFCLSPADSLRPFCTSFLV